VNFFYVASDLRIRIGIQNVLKMLDQGPYKMNTDPQLWLKNSIFFYLAYWYLVSETYIPLWGYRNQIRIGCLTGTTAYVALLYSIPDSVPGIDS
jgi:hypothetical protein